MGDRAAVDHMEIGVGKRGRDGVATGSELARQVLELRLIQLAAKVGKEDPHRGLL
jgi:hypothetical protein